MSSAFTSALSHLKSLADPLAPQSDDQLLSRFLDDSDERAFETLVQRHGPLVRSVCDRVLGNVPDVDDAFQACFLVLVRKAKSIRNPSALGPWLYGVALRVARKTAQKAARRKRLETSEPAAQPAATAGDMTLNELSGILDQEIGSLPEKYRAPLILCCLQGKSRDEAARELGWSLGAVKGRLERGREMLREKLSRRGVHLSLALFALLVPHTQAGAVLPSALLHSTLEAARTLAAGTLASPSLLIARAVLAEMAVERVRSWGVGLSLFLVSVFTLAAPWNGSAKSPIPPTMAAATEWSIDPPAPEPQPEPQPQTEPIAPPQATQTDKQEPQRRISPPRRAPKQGLSFVYSIHRRGQTSTFVTVVNRNGIRTTKTNSHDRR